LEPNDELEGDIGAAFALGVNVGTAIRKAKARATIKVFMTHPHVDRSFLHPLETWLRRRPGAVMAITSSGQFGVIGRDQA